VLYSSVLSCNVCTRHSEIQNVTSELDCTAPKYGLLFHCPIVVLEVSDYRSLGPDRGAALCRSP